MKYTETGNFSNLDAGYKHVTLLNCVIVSQSTMIQLGQQV